VLVSPDAVRVEAALSWKCSARGDVLFDAAWCSFWAPFHPGIAAADPQSGLLRAPAVRAEPGALLGAAARRHCYELHIGFTHLGWNIWIGTRLVWPRLPGVSPRSSRSAPAFDRPLKPARNRRPPQA
jgi:hypothetical protein